MNLANTFQVIDPATAVTPSAIIAVKCDRRSALERAVVVYEQRARKYRPLQLPVVSEYDTFRHGVALHEVPMSAPESRTTVRVYDMDGHDTLVRVSLEVGGLMIWDAIVPLRSATVGDPELQPSYAEVLVPSAPEPYAGRLEIQPIDGAEHRLWAMASVTSADSSDARVILPAGGSETWREECGGAD